MLGRETDLFVIDLGKGELYNLGYDSSYIKAQKLIKRLATGLNKKEIGKRFSIISGIEFDGTSKTKIMSKYTVS